MSPIDYQKYELKEKARFALIALILGMTGLVLSAVAWIVDANHFFSSWLVGFMFWTTLVLGSLFFTMLHHVTGAIWSVVIRRGAEAMSFTIPLLFVFFLPLLFGTHNLFHWADNEALSHDPLLQWKAPYLNVTFFIIRAIGFFAIWFLLSHFLTSHSCKQDSDMDAAHSRTLRKISAGGMFLFAFTLTFAAFDWLMSLSPHWYSTIFGVYIFVGGFLACLCFMTLFYQMLRKKGTLIEAVTLDHFHDLGRMIFAFTVFWAYIGASQYFLIWYANIPEETIWYINRSVGSWKTVSLSLVFLHFLVPFLTLAFFNAKRNMVILRGIAILLLVMHYIDMYWLVMPSHFPEGAPFSWMDIGPLTCIGGFVLWMFYRRFAAKAMLPLHDPNLAKSIAHRV